MKLVIILVALLLPLVGCFSEEVTQEPSQIPLPKELAADAVPVVVPGHLEMNVERKILPVGKNPFGVILSPDGKRAYVALAQEGEISVVDVFDLDVTETWGPFGEFLYQAIPSHDGNILFAYGLNGEHLVAIDTQTGRLRKKLSIGANISDAVYGPDNTLLVASTAQRKVSVLDQATLEVKGEIQFAHPIGYIEVGTTGTVACATGGVYTHTKGRSHAKGGPVSFFDPRKSGEAKEADVLRVGEHTRKPLFVQGDRLLLVPDRLDGTVRVFDVKEQSLIKIIDVGQGPEKVLVHPTLPEAYTIDTLARSVTVINLDQLEMERQIDLPSNPEDGIVSPDGHHLYLTLSAGSLVNNKLAVIDLEHKERIDLIPTGKDPCRMALTPDGKTLFVTNFLGNTLSIIR